MRSRLAAIDHTTVIAQHRCPAAPKRTVALNDDPKPLMMRADILLLVKRMHCQLIDGWNDSGLLNQPIDLSNGEVGQYIWSVRWYGLIERVQLPKPTRPSLSHLHYTLRSPASTRASARTC